jgi:non-specific serine/threonine protein kinase
MTKRVDGEDRRGHDVSEGLRFVTSGSRMDIQRPESAPPSVAVVGSTGPRYPRAAVPSTLTPLVGRRREIEAISALLRSAGAEWAPRLVTLTGPGGIGKTRLAIALGNELAGNTSIGRPPGTGHGFADGAAFVPLAPVRDPALVVPTIAHALDVPDIDERNPIDRLVATIGRSRLLLILDNLEQLTAAGSDLAELLDRCPGLTIVATSREPLRVSAEREYPIAALGLPPAGRPATVESLAASEAVRLFVDRARGTRPDFAVTEANAPVVAAICTRLDGLPLAIELAAARLRHFSPSALLARLSHQLDILTGGPRDQPARLQTMRDAIAWSHDLLTEDDQTLFRRLGVFAGGFTLEAAEHVDGQTDGSSLSVCPPVRLSVLDRIASLVDKSLIGPVAVEGAPRYQMLETVRSFAVERLEASGEAEEIRARHAAYFLGLAEQANRAESGGSAAALEWLERDYDNLWSALVWHEAAGDVEGLLRFAGAMAFYWFYRGRRQEGLVALARAIEWADREASASDRVRAFALAQAGLLATVMGDAERAIAWFGESVRLAAAAGDVEVEVMAHVRLGGVLVGQGRYDEAAPHFEANIERARTLGEDAWWLAHAEFHLGLIAFARGETGVARSWLRAAADRYDRAGQTWNAVDPLRYLGLLACDTGDVASAKALFADNLARLRAVGSRQGLATSLADLAVLATTVGKPTEAAQLFGAAEALRAAEGTTFSLPGRGRYQAARVRARAALGAARFDEAFDAGAGQPLPEALALAEDLLAQTPEPAAATSPDEPFGLTEREIEVLRLLAVGHSDRGIGDVLSISPRTVARHLQSIYRKIGVNSRVAATAFAHREGLV